MRTVKTPSFIALAVMVLALAASSFLDTPAARIGGAALAADASSLRVTGAASCSAAKCHGGTEPKKNEYSIWIAKDKHAKSYNVLFEKESKEIAKAMGIAAAETSDRCLDCHSMNVPEPLRGEKFDIADGNTCEQCHGPAEKYLEPHAEEGWTKEKSLEIGALDTRDIYVRADTCIPCHVGIDHDMIEAGHPYAPIELDTFTATMPPHWEPKPVWESPKSWAVGQAVALRDALVWVAKRAGGDSPDDHLRDIWLESYGRYLALKTIGEHASSATMSKIADAMEAMKKAHASGDKASLAKAKETSADADSLARALNGITFDAALTKRALAGIPAQAAAFAGTGIQTAEQLAMSLDTLSKTLEAGGVQPAGLADAVDAVYSELPEDPAEFQEAAFAEKLGAAAAAVK